MVTSYLHFHLNSCATITPSFTQTFMYFIARYFYSKRIF